MTEAQAQAFIARIAATEKHIQAEIIRGSRSKWTKTNVKPSALLAGGEDAVAADRVRPLSQNGISHSD